MEIINRRQRMFSISRKLRREAKTVAFVPTMGALHAGHLKLVEEARQRCDILIVSIFVNPTQFNDKGDLEKYPRDLTADAAMLAEYDVDYIFAPDADEIYPAGFSTYVDVEGVTTTLEGGSRPGHFRGVATVVTILFNTVRPDLAFFGQKDAQQVAVIKRLTYDLGFETEIVVVPTVREESGLAMSSRNERLSPEEREKAAVIIDALREAKTAFKKGERNAADLAQIVKDRIATEVMANLDYVAIVDRDSLQTIEKIGDEEALILIAVKFGPVRLIDNVILNRKQ
ncbi:MAG: pantoate--beta-alanine ligase [Acidobacteria bacterium]|nr:pantoate--beta-alanine ligase [Acidobacteriota bacterium]MBP7475256.1 pantoate--beta-alanine ligase [Pyrinomonadaceae bacterium]MBP9109329.1 pantoate--beta-alanine ligase [Pyrinomonadaceae bacterium]